MDLKNKTISELEAIRDEIESLIETKRVENKVAVLDEIKRIAHESGFTVEQLMGIGPKPAKTAKVAKAKSPTDKRLGSVPPKYKSKDGATWTGRGRRPNWVVAIQDAGGNLEDYVI